MLLEGMLANLVDNALRYGRAAAPATVTVEIEQHDDDVLIAVTDNGPGLVAEHRDSMKQRWTQGMAGVKLGAGAGLGLAIASRYAELMGGTCSSMSDRRPRRARRRAIAIGSVGADVARRVSRPTTRRR